MKDIRGKMPKVGDLIFFQTTGRYSEAILGRVSRFTPKRFFVEVLRSDRDSQPGDEKVVQTTFVIVE